MSNKDIINKLKLISALLELHGANQFKTKAYSSTVFTIERLGERLEDKSEAEMIDLGISKGMAAKIIQILAEETTDELEKLLAETPNGVIQMLEIKGIGAKKIKIVWQELGIETIPDLKIACQEGSIAQLKGFGDKTQQSIIEQIEFRSANAGKLLYSKAETFAQTLEKYLTDELPEAQVVVSGQIRRRMEIIDCLQITLGADDFSKAKAVLSDLPEIKHDERKSGPFVWRGIISENELPVEVQFTSKAKFANSLLLNSATEKHLQTEIQGQTLRKLTQSEAFQSEESIYQKLGLPFVEPEMREGLFEFDLAKANKLPKLVEEADLKGVLHNHSSYSDGKHTLREMAEAAIAQGYEYLGITDHSKTAFYAHGLKEERIQEQHAEIDALNKELAPFKIFKGIESDILSDGSLDYADDVLASFDFIVSSIHGNLNMEREKATERLVNAIRNPFTSILGHPTGRLLLKREGYPIDHQVVIDACAENGVSIEINANPMRLDLDWRWVHYALTKGIQIAINPDAHDREHYKFMRFGLLVGRKAGLTKEMTLNALSREELTKWFEEKKQGRLEVGS